MHSGLPDGESRLFLRYVYRFDTIPRTAYDGQADARILPIALSRLSDMIMTVIKKQFAIASKSLQCHDNPMCK